MWTVDSEEIGKIMTAGPVSEFWGPYTPFNLTAFDSLHLIQLLLPCHLIVSMRVASMRNFADDSSMELEVAWHR